MPKLVEVQSVKETARIFLPDIFLQVAVDRALDAAPEFELVRCKECRKRYDPKGCPMCVVVYGEQHDYTHDEGYCDRGERKGNEQR